MKFVDLTGSRFSRLVVTARGENSTRGHTRWICLCDCGNSSLVLSYNLNNGHTTSCGCHRDTVAITHGGTDTRLHNIWDGMKQRCNNPNRPEAHNYGGKGVTYDPGWEMFVDFRDWALANGYADHLCLDRIDSGGNYEPSNCQWITRAENTARRNHR